MVSVLTESSCSRYVEFKAVKRVYTLSNGRPEQVPCSRADVFSSQVREEEEEEEEITRQRWAG